MNYQPALIDIGALSCECADHALETLAKAIAGEGGESPDIWAKHESPFVQSLIELFSSRGLMRIEKVKTELQAWIDGKKHHPSPAPVPQLDLFKPAALKWTPDEVQLAKLYLENLSPDQFKPEDWGLLVDYLAHRYLPADTMQTESEWLAVRSTLMGKIEAAVAHEITVQAADTLLAALPLTIAEAKQAFHFSGAVEQIMQFAKVNCADQIESLTDAMRHRLKRVILNHQEQVLRGDVQPKAALQTQLFDEFSALNRDWRRIAVTEVGNNANNGVIASLTPGSRVKRIEQYRGACPFCKKIHGRVLTVVPASKKNKDGELEVWVGKSNIGRSASPRKKTQEGLIERTDAERWWIPAGTVHPHCRGIWHVLEGPQPGDDPSFAAWLDKHLHQHKIGKDAA